MITNLSLVPNDVIMAYPRVYGAIANVATDIAKTGISKDRKNEQQGYKFRGIDEVFNALSPLLAKHRLIILPRVLTRAQTERTTAKGGVLFSVIVEAEFDFVSAEDGSKHTVRTFGEGMDSADKATNKAMSAAYKYAAFQTFCIPLEGSMDDGDKDHYDVAPRGVNPQTGEEAKAPAVPEGYDNWIADLEATADEGLTKLQDAWKASSNERRAHLTKHEAQRWANIKHRAEQVKGGAA